MSESSRRTGDGTDRIRRAGVQALRGARQATPVAAAVVAALYPFASVLAAAEDDGPAPKLQEIIVTATKRELNAEDLGQSITVVTSEDMKKLDIRRMEDYVRSLPSVSLDQVSPGRNSIVMRGLSTGPGDPYTDGQVAIYVDEQPVTTVSQEIDLRMIDINRVEALPGPQGTLFGSSSQTGTLHIVTNHPDPNNFAASIETSGGKIKGGDWNYDVDGWINIPLIEDTLAIRAVAYRSHEGGYVDNVLGTTLDGTSTNAAFVKKNQNTMDAVGGRVVARWKINDAWNLDLSYIAQNQKVNGAWESDPALGDFKITRFFNDQHADNWHQFAATIKGDLGFADLTVTGAKFDRHITYETDNMVYEQFKSAYFSAYPIYDTNGTFGTVFNDQSVTRKSFEARLSSKGDSRFKWLIGAFYEDLDIHWDYGVKNNQLTSTTAWQAAQYYACYDAYQGYGVSCPLPDTNVELDENYENIVKQKAIFGELGYDLTSKWNVTVGARWFEFNRETRSADQWPLGLPPLGTEDTGGLVTSGGNDKDTVYKASTTFRPYKGLMVYALFSEGFRLGGSNSERAAATGLIPLTYQPDTVKNYEAGIKTRFLNDRAQLDITVFSLDWSNIQMSEPGIAGRWWLRGTINGGGARNDGVDVAAQWQATERLSVNAKGTYDNPRLTDPIVLFTGTVPAGSPMVWSAKTKFSLGAEYVVPGVLGGNLRMGYDFSYEGKKTGDINNIINNDPAGTVPVWHQSNLHLGLALAGGWDVQADVLNLFDQRSFNSLVNDYNFDADYFGDPRFHRLRNYTRPRTFSITLRKSFGSAK